MSFDKSRFCAAVLTIGVLMAPVVGISEFSNTDSSRLRDIKLDVGDTLSDVEMICKALGGTWNDFEGVYGWGGENFRTYLDAISGETHFKYSHSIDSGAANFEPRTYVNLFGLVSGFNPERDENGILVDIYGRSVGLLEYAGRTSDDTRAGLFDVRHYPTDDGPNPLATTTTVAQAVVDIRDMLQERSSEPANLFTNAIAAMMYPVSVGASNMSNFVDRVSGDLSQFVRQYDVAPVYINSILSGIPDLQGYSEFDDYEEDAQRYGLEPFFDTVSNGDKTMLNQEYNKLGQARLQVRRAIGGANAIRFKAFNTYYLYSLLKKRWFTVANDGSGITPGDLQYEVSQITTNELNTMGVSENLGELDLGDDINPLVDNSYNDQLAGIEDIDDTDDAMHNLTEIIGEVGDNLEDWVDSLPVGDSEGYGLQLQVSMPAICGTSVDSFYINFNPDSSMISKYEKFWQIISGIVHLGCYLYGAFHLWNMLIDRESLHGTDILGSD